jgi:HSP20 family protein
MKMTAHLGTFIPLQGQNTGWGSNGLSQNVGWGVAGLNPSLALNPNAIWGQNLSHNPQNASVLIVPSTGYSYGANFGEITQTALTPSGSTVAFIPHHNHIAGGAFVPTNATVQGIGAGGTVFGVAAGGNQALGGIALGNTPISQSFAAELSENNQEYVLSFDVPGIEMQDLDISLTGNTIYINGIRKGSQEATTLAYSEISKGSITRAIAVPFDVSPNKAINTSLENGVLKIRIAKESQADKRATSRKVKIG